MAVILANKEIAVNFLHVAPSRHLTAIKVLAPFAAFEFTLIVIQIEGARLVRALKRFGATGVRRAYLLARWSVYEFPF